jgi:hypothetical protein
MIVLHDGVGDTGFSYNRVAVFGTDRATLPEGVCVADESLDAWFAREVLSHEAAPVRYLTRASFARDEIHDMRQEVYLRMYEAAAKAHPHAPKSVLIHRCQTSGCRSGPTEARSFY